MLYAKALEQAQCESVGTAIRKGLLFAGGVQRTTNERLTRRVIFFGTTAGGDYPRPCRSENNWAHCLADDLIIFQATEGSTEGYPFLFGVETAFWPRAAKKSGKWYGGVVEAADGFMARWHRDEAERSRLRHAAEDAKNGDKEGWGGGKGSPTDPAVDECRNEMIERVTRVSVRLALEF